MKTALKIYIIALTTAAFSVVGFAQTKAPTAPSAPAMEKSAEKTSEKSDDGVKTKTKTKAKSKSKTKKPTKKSSEKMTTEEKQSDTMEKKTK